MGGFHLWILRVSAFGPFEGVFAIWLAFALYQGLFYGLVTGLTHLLKKKGLNIGLTLPLLWTLGEYVRHLGILGNSSGALGYTLTPYPALSIHAQSVWVWGLSAGIVFINYLLYQTLKTRDKRLFYLFISLLAIVFATGQSKLEKTDTTLPISVALIQGNHPQKYKQSRSNWSPIKETYFRLTKQVSTPSKTLIVWPETITSQLNLSSRSFRRKLERWSQSAPQHSLLFGTPVRQNNAYYNAVALVENGQISKQQYHKEILMPYGEYFPGKSVFEKLGLQNLLKGAVYEFGQNQSPMTIQNGTLTIGVAICLEAIYPHHFAKTNADIYTVHANNAWFFDSSTSEKLLQMSRLRAIENRRPVLHVANTGVSAIIDATGQKRQSAPLNTRKILQLN